MLKPLNITDAERAGCQITYNVNRFEVYTKTGMFLTAAYSKADLIEQLRVNRITDARYDVIAQNKYLTA